MNQFEMMVVAVAITALLMAVSVIVLFAVFHRKLDRVYEAVVTRLHTVEQALAGQGEKLAVIHHVATTGASPANNGPGTPGAAQ